MPLAWVPSAEGIVDRGVVTEAAAQQAMSLAAAIKVESHHLPIVLDSTECGSVIVVAAQRAEAREGIVDLVILPMAEEEAVDAAIAVGVCPTN